MTLKLGSHVSMSGKKMLVGSVEEALGYDANAMMIYTGAPQNTRRKDLEELMIPEGIALLEENGMTSKDIIVHAPYIINLGNTIKPATYELAVEFLAKEIERSEAIGAEHIVLHPGAHVGEGADAGIARIIQGLNEVIKKDQKIKIALETMAGKGTECGRSFDEIAKIIDGVTFNEHLSVCFDTCHVHDAGYNLKEDVDGVLHEFDKIVGADRIGVFHINDSKNPVGAHKDRHENIGFGYIGFDALNKVTHHQDFPGVVRILETPYVENNSGVKVAPYLEEIKMLRDGTFDPELIERIKQK